jgi:hypothetical protein
VTEISPTNVKLPELRIRACAHSDRTVTAALKGQFANEGEISIVDCRQDHAAGKAGTRAYVIAGRSGELNGM